MKPNPCYPKDKRFSHHSQKRSPLPECQTCTPQGLERGECEPHIAHIIFDFGSTIAPKSYTKDRLERKIKADLGLPNRTFLFHDDAKDLLQEGKITEIDFLRNMLYKAGIVPKKEKLEQYMREWQTICYEHVDPIPEMYELIKTLKKEYNVSLLSDVHRLKADVNKERGLYRVFDHLFLSCDILSQKPQREIYEYVLNRLEELAHEILFIDNNLENLKTARMMGIHTLHLDNTTYNPEIITAFTRKLYEFLQMSEKLPLQKTEALGPSKVFNTTKSNDIILDKIEVKGSNAILKVVLGNQATNTYFFGKDNEVFLIDPAFEMDKIRFHLLEKGYKIHTILLTHGHLDHWAGLQESFLSTPLAYNAKDCKENAPSSPIKAISSCPRHPDVNLEEGTIIEMDGLRLEVIETPGHSPGSLSFVCPSERLIFVGDIITEKGAGRTGHPGSDDNLKRESVLKILSYPDDYTLYPSHGTAFTIAEFKERFPDIAYTDALMVKKTDFRCDDIESIKKYLETIYNPDCFNNIGNIEAIVKKCNNILSEDDFKTKIIYAYFDNEKDENYNKWNNIMENGRQTFKRIAKLYNTENSFLLVLNSVIKKIAKALNELYNDPLFRKATKFSQIEVHDYYYKHYSKYNLRREFVRGIGRISRETFDIFKKSNKNWKGLFYNRKEDSFLFQNPEGEPATVFDYFSNRLCNRGYFMVTPSTKYTLLEITPLFLADYYSMSEFLVVFNDKLKNNVLHQTIKLYLAHELYHQYTANWKSLYVREIITEFLKVVYYITHRADFDDLKGFIEKNRRRFSLIHSEYFKGTVFLCFLFDFAELYNIPNQNETLNHALSFSQNYRASQPLDESFRFLHKVARIRFGDDIMKDISFETLNSMLNTYQKYINGLDRAITREERGEKGKIKKFGLEQEFELFSFNTFREMFKKKGESDDAQSADGSEPKYLYPSEFEYPYYLAGCAFLKIIGENILQIQNSEDITEIQKNFYKKVEDQLQKKYINMDFIYNIRNKNVGVVEISEKTDPKKQTSLFKRLSKLSNAMKNAEPHEKIGFAKKRAEIYKEEGLLKDLKHEYFSLAMLYEQIDNFKKAIKYYEIANDLDNQIYNRDYPSPNAEELKNLMKMYKGDTAKVREWLDNRFQGLNLSNPPSCLSWQKEHKDSDNLLDPDVFREEFGEDLF